MDANVNRRVLQRLGIQHVWIGIVLPILWGVGWVFEGPISLVASPVWGGIVFFIPTGILGILAARVQSRPLIMASFVMSILSAIAAVIVIIVRSVATAADFGFYFYYYADVSLDILSILLGVLELILAIMSSVYSMRVLSAPALPDGQVAVTYNQQGVIVTTGQVQQYPGAYPEQPQGQYPGQPQGQYPGQPQGQYPGQPQGQYPGPSQAQQGVAPQYKY